MEGPPKQSEKAWPQGQPQPVPKGLPRSNEQAGDVSMHRGWFKVWRKWADHEVASDANAWLILTHILCETRRAPKENRRYGYVLARGQCDLTQGQLEERTGLSRKSIREAIIRLVRYGTIIYGTQKGHQPAIITVVNYDTYNPDTTDNGTQNGIPNGQQTAIEGPTNGQQTATPLEVKKDETVEKETKTPAADKPQRIRKPSFADNWLPEFRKLLAFDLDDRRCCIAINKLKGIAGEKALIDTIGQLQGRGWKGENPEHVWAYMGAALKSKSPVIQEKQYEDKID